MCFHKIFCLCSWEHVFPVMLRTKNHCAGCSYERDRYRDRGWQKQRQRERGAETGNNHNCHNLPRVNNSKDNITRNMFLPGDVQRIFPQHSSENHNSHSTWGAWLKGAGAQRTVPTADGRFLPALQTAEATHTHRLASLPGTQASRPSQHTLLPTLPPPLALYSGGPKLWHQSKTSPLSWVPDLQLQTPQPPLLKMPTSSILSPLFLKSTKSTLLISDCLVIHNW